MSSDKISLNRGTTPTAALDAARTALEKKGFKWIQTGGSSAEAHEGGKEITKKRSRKLLLRLQVQGSNMVLEKGSNGAEGFAAGMGATTAMRVTRHFRKARHSVEDALKSSGLA
jgi:hypothetical protein